jgi:serine/threonine protein kinase
VPELILGKTNYDSKVDIFPAGCILAELFLLEPLFPGKTEGMQIFEYMRVVGYPGNSYFKNFNIPEYLLDEIKNTKINKIKIFHIY